MLRINSPCPRWRSGRWHQARGNSNGRVGVSFSFLAQVSKYSIESLPRLIGYDVLILNTAVRRFDNHSD
jgi:hypothetical protein